MELINQIDETFKFEDKEIRVIGNYNDPLFVAKDICTILELSNITEALRNIPEKWRTSEILKCANGQNMNMIVLKEPAVYQLIMRSTKPMAKAFQEVVCEEILPSLRKKGEYKIQSIIDRNKILEEEKLKIEEDNKRLEEEKRKADIRIKQLGNKVLSKQKRTQYEDRNYIYIVQDEYHKKDRIFVMGKAVILEDRLASYNKTRDHDVIYCRRCNSAQQMNYIEKCVLSKLDKYREVANRDRFILPEDKDISLFTDVVDLFIDAFDDVDPEVDVEKLFSKEEKKEDIQKAYFEDYKEEMTEYNKKYYEEHKEEFAKYKKEQYENNKEAVISRSKEYYEEHKEDVLERTKKHYAKKKDKILEYQATKITCECGMTIQRNYSAKHKRSEIHKVSLEHKLNGNPPTTKIKFECECGQSITKNYLKRHLKSAMHAIALRLKLEKQDTTVEENVISI